MWSFYDNYLCTSVDFRIHCLVCLVTPRPHDVEQGVHGDHGDHSPQSLVSFVFHVEFTLKPVTLSLPKIYKTYVILQLIEFKHY